MRFSFDLDQTTFLREAVEEKVAKERERLRLALIDIITVMRVRFHDNLPADLRKRLQKYSHDELCDVNARVPTAASAEDVLAIPPSESPGLAPR